MGLVELFPEGPAVPAAPPQVRPTPRQVVAPPAVVQAPLPAWLLGEDEPAAPVAVVSSSVVDGAVVLPVVEIPLADPPSVVPIADVVTPAMIDAAGPFVYISGAAGTGKTWLARELAGRPDTVLCATTGIAAVNLGDAATINSLLGYFNTQSLLEKYATGYLGARLRSLMRSGIRRIVLDEVSMLDGDQLTCLVQALNEVAQTRSYDQDIEQVVETDRDDRRLSLVLVGDFAQLPPVSAPFAFESPEWHRFDDATFKLTTVRRQGDKAFVEALQNVRRGNPDPAISTFRNNFSLKFDFDFVGATIVAKNDEVTRINTLRHSKLAGNPLTWKTQRSGEQQKDWINLIPEVLEVKVGALVMLLANRAIPKLDEDDAVAGYFYVNGDLGMVEALTKNGIQVKLLRTGKSQEVVPVVREWQEPTGLKKPAYTTKGAVTYMPMRLAYATTVHKSQGLSLDHVQVAIHSWMFDKPGMSYVALSRCRTLEGLRIIGNEKQLRGKCTVDPKVEGWI